jgi:hemerythrin-like domain-containing protein
MSVLDTLAGEHALFRRLIGRLQQALRLDEDSARRQARNVLLVLLPALERHEELEDLVFGRRDGPRRGTRQAIVELNKEHWRIALLRSELVEAMEASERVPWERYRGLAQAAAARLREHFELEEQSLWPRYRALARRSRDPGLERRAREQLKRLLRETDRREALASEYERRP